MFYIQFFKRNRLRTVSDMSAASKWCSLTSTRSTRLSPQVGTSCFKKHIWHMFYIQFFKRNRSGIVSDMSDASKSCSMTSTTSTWPSPASGYVNQHIKRMPCMFLRNWHIYLWTRLGWCRRRWARLREDKEGEEEGKGKNEVTRNGESGEAKLEWGKTSFFPNVGRNIKTSISYFSLPFLLIFLFSQSSHLFPFLFFPFLPSLWGS